ncbi:MAG: heparinase II/III family protein [Lentisphaeraceae bacterium]|nr:heparinase II/III family protein [Lentisphaeraceae bacterium]
MIDSPWIHRKLIIFDKTVNAIEDIPVWNKSYVSGKTFEKINIHWSEIPDFDNSSGDIKEIWELSRFSWVVNFAQAYAVTKDKKWLDKLNLWLESWSETNPVNRGPNWKCGQETSIRVMHLISASYLLGQHNNSCTSLVKMIEQHLRRIHSTIHYAMAQNNNHGSSEAAALLIGAMFLKSNNSQCKEIDKWLSNGRYWLENRVHLLIMDDGSFSQYSSNYHRMVLDTLSLAEFFRRVYGQPLFSDPFYSKVTRACLWLAAMTDEVSGDVPNIGANDGARLIPLVSTGYRDYRPSVQLASVLFRGHKFFEASDEILQWFDLNCSDAKSDINNIVYANGGYTILRSTGCKVVIKYPVYKFRPSHADALHVDFWYGGQSVLRDGGSYSYNTDEDVMSYFSGVKSHNTIEFDGHDQMPKLSRFLYGSWLKTKMAKLIHDRSFMASYIGNYGEFHQRKIELMGDSLLIEDEISGFKKSAILRWRLIPGKWLLADNQVKNGDFTLSVKSSARIIRFEIVEGYESRYYLEKTSLPVLEVEVEAAGKLVTEVSWK